MKHIEGAEKIRQEFPDILHDESSFESGVPESVYFPETADDLRTALSAASAKGMKVTFVGGRTGTTGGAVPEEGNCAITFSAMNRIRKVEHLDGRPVLVCDPGVTLEEVGRFLQSPAAWPYKVCGSESLGNEGFFYPPDPTEATAQLGGTVATNASGARSYLFGPSRRHIAFLELMFANGDTAVVRRSADNNTPWNRKVITESGSQILVPPLPYTSPGIKNASGYYNSPDMEAVDLFIGSEGTLAAITGIGIFLHPKVRIVSGLSFFGCDKGAFDFADFLRNENSVAAIEFFDGGSLSFIDRYRNRMSGSFPEFPVDSKAAILWEYIENGLGNFENEMEKWEEALLDCGSSFDSTWSGFEDSENKRLHNFRHALPETINGIIAQNKRSCAGIRKIGTDSAFPAGRFRNCYKEMMRLINKSNLTFAAFGHLGDYHIHINLIPYSADELSKALGLYDELMSLAISNGGTVSAEHGIGKIKKKYLAAMYGEEGIAAMRAVKSSLDPQGMLNPGNLF